MPDLVHDRDGDGQLEGKSDQQIFDLAVKSWADAGVLIESPPWKGFPLSVAVRDHISRHPERFEARLESLLDHPRAVVAAFALAALRDAASPVLLRLPAKLLERRDKLTIRTGSFQTVTDLGGFARRLAKVARARNARE